MLSLIGCKKENTELNKEVITISLLPMRKKNTSVVDTSVLYTYIMKALITSPAKVDVEDHGFIITAYYGGSIVHSERLSIGQGTVMGYVEKEYTSPYLREELSIVAYVLLKNGETIYSSVSNNSSIETDTLGFFSDLMHTSIPGYEKFTIDFTNYDTTKYAITSVLVQYVTVSDFLKLYDYNGQGYSYLLNNESNAHFEISIPNNHLVSGKTYVYRAAIMIWDLTNSSPSGYIYSKNEVFIAQ